MSDTEKPEWRDIDSAPKDGSSIYILFRDTETLEWKVKIAWWVSEAEAHTNRDVYDPFDFGFWYQDGTLKEKIEHPEAWREIEENKVRNLIDEFIKWIIESKMIEGGATSINNPKEKASFLPNRESILEGVKISELEIRRQEKKAAEGIEYSFFDLASSRLYILRIVHPRMIVTDENMVRVRSHFTRDCRDRDTAFNSIEGFRDYIKKNYGMRSEILSE